MGYTFLGHELNGVRCNPAFFSNNHSLVSGDYHGRLHLWFLVKKNTLSKMSKCHNHALVQIKVISDTGKFITASWDGFVKYWFF